DHDSNESVMISSPEFHYEGQTLTLPVFNVTSDLSVSGSSSDLRVGSSSEPRRVFEENPVVGGAIEVQVESDYYEAWGDYFDERTQSRDVTYDHSNERVSVDLVVPEDNDLDGGQAFREDVSGKDRVFEDGYDSGSYYIEADDYVEEGISSAESSNDNSGECVDEDDGFDNCNGDTIPGGTYYIDGDAEMGHDIEFDEEENVTVAIDGGLNQQGGDVNVEHNLSDDTGVELLVGGGDFTMGGNPDLNTGSADNDSSDLLIFVHSDHDVDLNGGGNGGAHATLYAPGSYIEFNGMGNHGWRGGIIGNNMRVNGGGAGGIYDGSEVEMDLTQGSTITYLHVTENEVFVEE
ncbi:MAG: hypothetical protein ACLFMT_06030, partial [Halobacteriales archaeon]